MDAASYARLPVCIQVRGLLRSRYDCMPARPDPAEGARPRSWDMRTAGEDLVISLAGETIKFLSSAGQSPSKPGWALVSRTGDVQGGFAWIFYGFGA